MKRVMIIGSRGQDGSYLSDLLKDQGVFAVGLSRRGGMCSDGTSTPPFDVTRADLVERMLRDHHPEEIYYLAAFHHSSDERIDHESGLLDSSFRVHVQGLSHVLEAARDLPAKVFYAASSHIFGSVETAPQNEQTPIKPQCVYGLTKAAGMALCRYYRQRYNVFASCGILYNHESPRRGKQFVTQAIVAKAKAIAGGQPDELVLGNLKARVDWGWAPDYVDAMRRIMALSSPDDFIIATGRTHSIADFAQAAFECVGLDWRTYVKEDTTLIQKRNNDHLCGSYAKLKAATGWQPTAGFKELVGRMVKGE